MNDQYEREAYRYENQGYYQDMEPVMTVGQWLITALVMAIPCVNVVMLFVWGFGSGNRNRANYCKAALILWLLGAVVSLIAGVSISMAGFLLL